MYHGARAHDRPLEESASDAEASFRAALVEQSLAGVYTIRDERFVYANARMAEIFGYEVAELLALPSILDIVHPDDRQKVRENLKRRVEGELDDVRYEFRGSARDERELYVEVHGRRVQLEEGPAVAGILLDVTGRRKAERFYHQAEKMQALGRLAAGVAHDFNNILALIGTSAELMSARLADDAELREEVAQLMACVERGRRLGKQLMELGRTIPREGSLAPLPAVVRELVPVLEKVLGPTIRLEVRMEEGLPLVELDRTHAEEVLTNLVLNARDALSGGGKVTIALRGTRRPGIPAPKIRASAYLVLEVSDDGCGMDSHVLARLFEPYFTTKGDAGTGLGLPNVWRIVSGAGGVVEVESELGRGSTFRIVLPAR